MGVLTLVLTATKILRGHKLPRERVECVQRKMRIKPSATAAPQIPDLSLHSVLDISVWNINAGVGGRPLDPAEM